MHVDRAPPLYRILREPVEDGTRDYVLPHFMPVTLPKRTGSERRQLQYLSDYQHGETKRPETQEPVRVRDDRVSRDGGERQCDGKCQRREDRDHPDGDPDGEREQGEREVGEDRKDAGPDRVSESLPQLPTEFLGSPNNGRGSCQQNGFPSVRALLVERVRDVRHDGEEFLRTSVRRDQVAMERGPRRRHLPFVQKASGPEEGRQDRQEDSDVSKSHTTIP